MCQSQKALRKAALKWVLYRYWHFQHRVNHNSSWLVDFTKNWHSMGRDVGLLSQWSRCSLRVLWVISERSLSNICVISECSLDACVLSEYAQSVPRVCQGAVPPNGLSQWSLWTVSRKGLFQRSHWQVLSERSLPIVSPNSPWTVSPSGPSEQSLRKFPPNGPSKQSLQTFPPTVSPNGPSERSLQTVPPKSLYERSLRAVPPGGPSQLSPWTVPPNGLSTYRPSELSFQAVSPNGANNDLSGWSITNYGWTITVWGCILIFWGWMISFAKRLHLCLQVRINIRIVKDVWICADIPPLTDV